MLDKDFFCEQIKLYEKAMYFLAFSMVRNETDAAEIISESIYRAYKNLDSLKNKNAFKPWILKIVHNTCVDYIRKNTTIISFSDDIEPVNDGTENEIVTALSLKEAVNSLKLPYRTVVILYYYENMSIPEIAKITNTTGIAVKQRLSRARKQLYQILKEDF